jgi:hypothetical protein
MYRQTNRDSFHIPRVTYGEVDEKNGWTKKKSLKFCLFSIRYRGIEKKTKKQATLVSLVIQFFEDY